MGSVIQGAFQQPEQRKALKQFASSVEKAFDDLQAADVTITDADVLCLFVTFVVGMAEGLEIPEDEFREVLHNAVDAGWGSAS